MEFKLRLPKLFSRHILISTVAISLSVVNLAGPASAAQTPADQLIISKFKIGSTAYTVNGEQRQIDVAPYIKDGRTMMPVRFTAYAMGVDDSGIKPKPAGSGAVITRKDVSGANDVVGLTTGSLVVESGGMYTKDVVAPEIVQDRLFVPLRTVVQGLGGVAFFNTDTQEVTVVTWKNVPAKVKKQTNQQKSLTITKDTHPNIIVEDPRGGYMIDVAKYLQLWGIPEKNILYYVDPETKQ
ncbi:copper amine oxidase N-terminal domain-containing protein [Heliophilum fasciatum]|uniref:Copper amine oxidase-like protein n=1 Tax=Heliophilum fasciatum TaxID=35700 RepID=A0A4V2SVV8_9FIRM|nr:copper amine oxidase N-terminal domain-containing protein [Heliophilum fasciatum]MCW2279408.1 hypothetical protein [Heliophilum fasciatum]TCP59996.1 copper amine oxidase-like protein [Heliophilum fasciatum]